MKKLSIAKEVLFSEEFWDGFASVLGFSGEIYSEDVKQGEFSEKPKKFDRNSRGKKSFENSSVKVGNSMRKVLRDECF